VTSKSGYKSEYKPWFYERKKYEHKIPVKDLSEEPKRSSPHCNFSKMKFIHFGSFFEATLSFKTLLCDVLCNLNGMQTALLPASCPKYSVHASQWPHVAA
jgi:hypothetical protein